MRKDANKENTLGLQEREMMLEISGPQERLEYPTETLKMANGCEVEKYIIPEVDRQKVLDALYPFCNAPSLDDVLLDLHTRKKFTVRDYIVTREGNGNFLVTPYYAERGGTVLDWIPIEHDGALELLQMAMVALAALAAWGVIVACCDVETIKALQFWD